METGSALFLGILAKLAERFSRQIRNPLEDDERHDISHVLKPFLGPLELFAFLKYLVQILHQEGLVEVVLAGSREYDEMTVIDENEVEFDLETIDQASYIHRLQRRIGALRTELVALKAQPRVVLAPDLVEALLTIPSSALTVSERMHQWALRRILPGLLPLLYRLSNHSPNDAIRVMAAQLANMVEAMSSTQQRQPLAAADEAELSAIVDSVVSERLS